jgi:hypothetical protein
MANVTRSRTPKPDGPLPANNQRRPEVIVDFVFDDGLFFIAIENIGESPAIDVSVQFDKPFRGAGGDQVVSGLPLFHRITFLAPRRRIETFLDNSRDYFARGEPTDLGATVSYADSAGTRHTDVIRHDLAIYRDIAYVRTRPDS